MEQVGRVVLVGFSGAGKSTVAGLLAERLGWSALDTDAAIEREFGLTIPEVFRQHGEPAFRATERATLAQAMRQERVVVACGGGAIVDPAVWSADLLGRPDTLVVALDARPQTSLDRLREQQAAEGGARRATDAGRRRSARPHRDAEGDPSGRLRRRADHADRRRHPGRRGRGRDRRAPPPERARR